MKQDITQTALWQEFLEWVEFKKEELEITEHYIMFAGQIIKTGALIGLLEQFLWDKDKTFFNVATNMIKKFSCMVFALNEDAYHSKGEFDNPLLAKSEAIYQYFKSKG